MARTIGNAALAAACMLGATAPAAWATTKIKVQRQVLIQPDEGRGPLVALIEGAKASLEIVAPSFADEELARAVAAAAGRAVKVRVLLPAGADVASLAAARGAGAEVRAYRGPLKRIGASALVVDALRAVLMTHPLDAAAFSGSRGFGITTDDVAEALDIRAMFDADWNGGSTTSFLPSMAWGPLGAKRRLVQTIAGASDTLDLYATAIDDEAVLAALEAAAKKRVAVRILLPAATAAADGPVRARLAAARIQVAVLKSGLAANVVIADHGLGHANALVGSFSATTAALAESRELGITLRDPEALGRLDGTLRADWERASAN